MTDMKHLRYLQDVVDLDVREVQRKEATYMGSWKKSGGRSAWFMLRRKIDRMLEMLKRPEDFHGFDLANLDDAIASVNPDEDITLAGCIVQHLRDVYVSEDIFLKIEDDPSGQDGSVLAEVRDLRRYLLLIEAEMVARGVVELVQVGVTKTGEAVFVPKVGGSRAESNDPIASVDFGDIERRVMAQVAGGNIKADDYSKSFAEKYGPGTPEDGGHHERQQEQDPVFLQDSDDWKRDTKLCTGRS